MNNESGQCSWILVYSDYWALHFIWMKVARCRYSFSHEGWSHLLVQRQPAAIIRNMING